MGVGLDAEGSFLEEGELGSEVKFGGGTSLERGPGAVKDGVLHLGVTTSGNLIEVIHFV